MAESAVPRLAIKFNPLSADAVVASFASTVVASKEPVSEDMRRMVAQAVHLAPADARLYSMLGIIAEHDGDRATARQRYDQALRLLPTEFQALSRALSMDIEDGRIAEAVAKTDLFAKRWPAYWEAIEPALRPLLSREEGMAAFAVSYATNRGSRLRLIASLAKDLNGAELAYHLLLRWRALAVPELDRETARITEALLREKQAATAYFLFRQMLDEAGLRENGYVHNRRFALAVNDNPFNWSIRSQAGAELKVNDAPGQAGRRVDVHFLGNPLQLNNVAQLLRLPAGDYVLASEFATDSLATPRAIEFVVECVERGNKIGSFEFPQGTKERATGETVFTVPSNNCELARIRLANAFVALSFQNRFSGSIHINRVEIRRLGL